MNDLKFTTAGDFIDRLQKKPFRLWFTKLWEEHKLEKEHLGEALEYSASDYLKQNKSFLIRKFKEEYQNGY